MATMEPAPVRPNHVALRKLTQRLQASPGDGISSSAVVRVILTAVAVLCLLWIAWVSRPVVVWVAISGFIAVAIDPAVRLLRHRLKFPRALAIAAVYVVGLLAAAGAALLFVPPLVKAAQGLAGSLPGYIDRLGNSSFVQDLDREYSILNQLKTRAADALSGIAGPGVAVKAAQSVVNGLIALTSIAVLTFLFSLYGPRLREWALGLAERQGGQRRLGTVLKGMYDVIAGYIVGVFLIALCGASTAAIFMLFADIPYVPVLALWVGLMAFVPMVGATIGGIPYVAVAFFQSWKVGVTALIFLFAYQQVENHLVQPLIQRRTIRLNALWIIISVLVGAQAFGILGTLVAIPVAGIIQVLFQDWVAHYGQEHMPATGEERAEQDAGQSPPPTPAT